MTRDLDAEVHRRLGSENGVDMPPHTDDDAPERAWTPDGTSAPVRVFNANDPLAIARQFIADQYTLDGVRLLHLWRGDLYRYAGGHYRLLDDQALRCAIYAYLERAQRRAKDGPTAFRPTATAVNNVVDALRAAALLDVDLAPPTWLDGRASVPAAELIAMTNGLLHLPTGRLLPHSPALFTTNGLPFAYEPDAPEPVEWLAFLNTLWPDDPEAIETLQEILGYLISGDRRQQKMFLLVGPKRGGKDTIAKIARALVGEQNTEGPTLSDLASPFGLQSLIGKTLAVIGDARLSGRADQTAITERLLSITGESFQTVQRKHREAWSGLLPTRFLILTNELPRLEDASGALASRFIVLTLKKSWFGYEDLTLIDRLRGELPAIFAWSLDGLERLWDRGRFTAPSSSENVIRELEDLGSPIKHFVRERCEIGGGHEIAVSDLYEAWRRWNGENGKDRVSTQQVFGRDLHAAFPEITDGARRNGALRWRCYKGLRLAGSLL